MTKKILIVEDNKDLLEMFKLKFEKSWFEVFTAENGFNSLSLAVDNQPDLILLDIMMPNMDGFETLSVIREQTSLDTKIVIFSNIKNKAHIEKAKALWADDYLVKADYTPWEVLKKVSSMIDTTKKDNKKTIKVKCPNCNEILDVDISNI